MISAEEFLDVLENKGLLAPELIESLRTRVAQSMSPISSALLAQRLVEKGHLSRQIAQQIIDRADVQPGPASSVSRVTPDEVDEEEELGLAPLEEDGPVEPVAVEPVEVEPVEVEPVEVEPVEVEPVATPAMPTAVPQQTPTAKAILEEPTLLSGGSIDSLQGQKIKRLGGGKKRKKGNIWDSKLLLIGGGSLIVLVILMFSLFWATTQRGPKEMFEAAETDYRSGAYTQAIAKYDEFLKKYAGKEKERASIARVQQAMCRMRQATDGTSDFQGALAVADEQSSLVSGEVAFATEGRPELEAMLPVIAEGLTDMAYERSDEAIVLQAEKAVALVLKYIPASSRPVQRLKDIDAKLALAKREIAREDNLVIALAQMDQTLTEEESVTAEMTNLAYELRRALLKDYPSLVAESRLVEAVQAISQAELSAVEQLGDMPRASEGDVEPSADPAVVLANRLHREDADVEPGQTIFVHAAGAIYGLDGVNGSITWRRPTGVTLSSRSPGFVSTPVSGYAGSDAILVDRENEVVLRVEAATGRSRWRHPVGEVFDTQPVVSEDRLWIATRSGRLVVVDLESGDAVAGVRFPQELRTSPAIDERRETVYQFGVHSTLFVLSSTEVVPKMAVYTGHGPGTIAVEPVAIGPYLVYAENDGQQSSTLKVLSVEPTGEESPAFSLLQEVPLKGRVNTPIVASGSRLLCVTEVGTTYVFDVSGNADKEPLGLMAESAIGDESEGAIDDVQRFSLVQGGQVWIADRQLARFDIQASRRNLVPKDRLNPGSITLQPPLLIGGTVYHVRRKVGMPGVWVSAFDSNTSDLRWETYLAAGLAVAPSVHADGKKITAVTSLGAIFELDASMPGGDAMFPAPVEALAQAELRLPVTDVVMLDSLIAMVAAGGPPKIPVYDPESKSGLRLISFENPLTNAPIAFRSGVLLPCASGQVQLVSPRGGTPLAEPFQPRLEAGVAIQWRRPVLLSETEVLLADARSWVYRVGLREDPKPHLVELASTEAPAPIRSSLAVAGEAVYAVDESQMLVSFALPDLKPSPVRGLSGRCVWGPNRVGDHVLLSTDDEMLYRITASGQVTTSRLPYGPLVGQPLAIGGTDVLATTGGVVFSLDGASGDELGHVQLGRPLGTGPVALGSRVLVAGQDGCLYVVEIP